MILFYRDKSCIIVCHSYWTMYWIIFENLFFKKKSSSTLHYYSLISVNFYLRFWSTCCGSASLIDSWPFYLHFAIFYWWFEFSATFISLNRHKNLLSRSLYCKWKLWNYLLDLFDFQKATGFFFFGDWTLALFHSFILGRFLYHAIMAHALNVHGWGIKVR